MADISQIKLPSSETIYNIKDTVARDKITKLENIGRFLSLWNATTGLATTSPTTLPYTYKTGDYFRVSVVDNASQYEEYDEDTTYNTGDKCLYTSAYYICKEDNVTGTWDSTKWTAHTIINYKPEGTSYTGVASTTVETDTKLAVGDIYFFDGTTWSLQYNRDVASDMIGATASTAGVHGLVPAPAAGEQNEFLRGDGTWQPISVVLSNTASVHVTKTSAISYEVEHGLSTNLVIVQIIDDVTQETIIADVTRGISSKTTPSNWVKIDFSEAPVNNFTVLCTAMTTSSIDSGEEVEY